MFSTLFADLSQPCGDEIAVFRCAVCQIRTSHKSKVAAQRARQLHRSRTGHDVSTVFFVTDGRERSSKQHNKSKSPEFHVWVSMIQRCHNARSKQYPNYGGRGIVVCERWRNSFPSFLADVGPRPGGLDEKGRAIYSLDRIDNSRPYEPGNVRWATYKEQASNRRHPRRRTDLHGYSRYNNEHCRCQICTEAAKNYKRDYYLTRKVAK